MSNEVPVVRSIVAVAAGFFTSTVLSLGGDLAFRRLSPEAFDVGGRAVDEGALFIMMGYEALFVLLAGYVTARLAIRRPLTHALVAGVIILLARAFSVFLTWETGPTWFHIGILVLIIPVALLGAKLRDLLTT